MRVPAEKGALGHPRVLATSPISSVAHGARRIAFIDGLLLGDDRLRAEVPARLGPVAYIVMAFLVMAEVPARLGPVAVSLAAASGADAFPAGSRAPWALPSVLAPGAPWHVANRSVTHDTRRIPFLNGLNLRVCVRPHVRRHGDCVRYVCGPCPRVW